MVLASDENDNLIPDFFLEPLDSSFCDIVELKLPYTEMVRRLRSGKRVRFKAFVNEAIAQLNEYQRFFDNIQNRNHFHASYGLTAYRPRMILVIGRTHHFKSDIERHELKTLLPRDLELWTYDDLLSKARLYTESVSAVRTIG